MRAHVATAVSDLIKWHSAAKPEDVSFACAMAIMKGLVTGDHEGPGDR